MKRDLVYHYDRPLEAVFAAFVQAANQKFGKNCTIDQGKTIDFALNYSFKYNMNGGKLTMHFMPYQNGTAVDLRYTIVQLFGARYQKHAQELTQFVNGILQAQGTQITLDVNQFLAYEAQTPSTEPLLVQSQQTPYVPPAYPAYQQPQQPPQQAAGGTICPKCGSAASPGARFCAGCGGAIPAAPSFCSGCGAQLDGTERFCQQCGKPVE